MADELGPGLSPAYDPNEKQGGLPPGLSLAPTQFDLAPPTLVPSATDNVVNGSLTKPEVAAKALKVAPQVNVPPPVVALDPDSHQQDIDRDQAIAAVNANPNIRTYVEKSSLNASVSKGDFPALDNASKSMSQLEVERMQGMTFGRLLLEAAKNSPAGYLYGISSQSARLFSQGIMSGVGGSLKGVGTFLSLHPMYTEGTEYEPAPSEPKASPIYRIGQAVAETGAKIPTTQEERESLTGQIELGAGTMVPYIAATLLNPVVGTTAGFVGMGANSYNEAYEAAKNAGMSEADSRSAANWNGTVGGILGALPLPAANLVKATLGKIVVSGVAFSSLGEAQHYATTVIAKEYYDPNSTYTWDTKRALASFILGAGVGGAHVLAENATKERQTAEFKQYMLKQGKAQAEIDAIVKEAQSDVENHALEKALTDLSETKTKEMSEQATEDFAESHTGLIGSVLIPAYRVREIYDAEGKVPGRNDGLFGWIPDLGNKLDLALDSGAEIKIPIKKYLANMSGQMELHNKIADEVRLQEGGVTRREAKEAKEEAAAEVAPTGLDRQLSDLVDERKRLDEVAPPPVDPDSIRFYHGGDEPTTGGSRWVTPQEQYARHFRTAEGEEKAVHYVDIPKNRLTSDLSAGYDDINQLPRHFEAPEEFAKKLKPIDKENAALKQALDVATNPKAKQVDALAAAKWAKENDRPDIVQAIVDRAEMRVYKESGKGGGPRANFVDAYHGSQEVIEKLTPEKTRLGRGVFFAKDPELASGFAKGTKVDNDPARIYGEDTPAEIERWVREHASDKEGDRVKKLMEEADRLEWEDPNKDALVKEINDLVREYTALDTELGKEAGYGSPNVTRTKINLGKTLEFDMGGKFSWEKEAEALDKAREGNYDSVSFVNTGPHGDYYSVLKGEHIGEGKPTQTQNELRVLREETGVEPTPRPARDSLLAEYVTDPLAQQLIQEVVKERKSLYLDPIFKDPPPGVSKSLWEAYAKRLDKQHEDILTKAVELATKWHRERETTEWKARETEVRKDVEKDIRYDPAYAADRYFNGKEKGILPNGKYVPVYKFSELSDTRADDIAPRFGFQSGSEMVKAIIALEMDRADRGIGQAKQREEAIQAETTRRMEEKYGKLEDNIALAASDEALSITNFNILSAENRMLAELNGVTPPLTRGDLLDHYRDQFNKSMVDGVSYEKDRRAAEKAGYAAEKALLKGDVKEAFRQKQLQLIAVAMAKEAKKFEREVVKAETKFARLLNNQVISSIDQTHLDQMRSILAEVGYENKYEPIAPPVERRQWVADSEGQLAVADWLTGPPETKPPQVTSDMTVQQFRDLVSSIDSITHAGREINTLKSAEAEATIDNALFDLAKSASRFPTIENRINPTARQVVKGWARYVLAAHALVERVLDYTDGFDPKGVLTQYLDRPLRDAFSREIRLTEAVVDSLHKLEKYTTGDINKLVDNKVIPRGDNLSGYADLTVKNLRELALHMGNEEGVKKVTEGFGVRAEDVMRLLRENLKEGDWRWVEGMHKLWDNLYVEAAAMVLRDTGVPLGRKKAASIDTGLGFDIPGGYAPLIYDRDTSHINGHLAAKDPIFNGTYKGALPPHGYTTPLTNFSGPLDLTGTASAGKMRTMVHDIAFREAIRNANKLINRQEFKDVMRQAWGKEYADLFPGWLKHIANVQNRDDNYSRDAARALAFIRQNVTSSLIFLNPTTVIKHGSTAALMSINRVGVRGIAEAGKYLNPKTLWAQARDMMTRKAPLDQEFTDAVHSMIDPTEQGDINRQFVLDNSPFIRNRQKQASESIHGAYERASEAGKVQALSEIRDKAMTLGRLPVSLLDALSTMPTWSVAYKKAIGGGLEHQEAVYAADKEVSRTHGSNFPGDKPRVMMQENTVAGEAAKNFTIFYNFFNHFFNNVIQTGWDIRSRFPDRQTEAHATISNISGRLATIGLVVLVEELAGGWGQKKHGGIIAQAVEGLVKVLGGGIVGVRELTGALTKGYGPSTGAIGHIGKTIVDVRRDIIGKKASKDWLAHLGSVLGIATGAVGPAVGRMATFGIGVVRGKEKPHGAQDVVRGIFTGHARPKEGQPR